METVVGKKSFFRIEGERLHGACHIGGLGAALFRLFRFSRGKEELFSPEQRTAVEGVEGGEDPLFLHVARIVEELRPAEDLRGKESVVLCRRDAEKIQKFFQHAQHGPEELQIPARHEMFSQPEDPAEGGIRRKGMHAGRGDGGDHSVGQLGVRELFQRVGDGGSLPEEAVQRPCIDEALRETLAAPSGGIVDDAVLDALFPAQKRFVPDFLQKGIRTVKVDVRCGIRVAEPEGAVQRDLAGGLAHRDHDESCPHGLEPVPDVLTLPHAGKNDRVGLSSHGPHGPDAVFREMDPGGDVHDVSGRPFEFETGEPVHELPQIVHGVLSFPQDIALRGGLRRRPDQFVPLFGTVQKRTGTELGIWVETAAVEERGST